MSFREFFFFHVGPLVKKGKTKNLEFEDLMEVPSEVKIDRSPEVKALNLSSAKNFILGIMTEQKRSVLKSWSYMLLGTFASLSTPPLINRFVTTLTGLKLESVFDLQHAWLFVLAASVGLVGVVMGIGYQHYFYNALTTNLKIVARINRQVFDQALKLSQTARQKVAIGDVVNHMSSDSDTIADLTIIVGDMLWASLLLIGTISMLFYYLGWTAFVAVVVLMILTPITRKIAKGFVHLDEVMMARRDQRVTLMSQILQSMRLVKHFVWEAEVEKQVGAIRKSEIEARKNLAKAEMLSGVSFIAMTTLVLFTALWVHVLRGQELTPALVLTCVSLFGLLQEPVGHIPNSISRLTAAWVSASRLIVFLKADSVPERVPATFADKDLMIQFDSVQYTSVDSAFSMRNLNLNIRRNESVAVVGPVGSGKSTFLQLILGEFQAQVGAVKVASPSLSYVSQESYILNDTVLENLKMGNENVTKEQVRKALHASAMDRDIRLLPGGLRTEIGEKGVNLSGGQKQRLALARCVLQEPEVVLLDDPLSAVDVDTEQVLVDRLIFGTWANRTRVVATHRLESLAKFDRVIFLDQGQVKANGTLSEILATSEDFRQFYSHHENIQGAEKKSAAAEVQTEANAESESRLMTEEDREQGAVKGSLYWDYILALGGESKFKAFNIGVLIFGVLAVATFPLVCQWWLSHFTSHSEIKPMHGVLVYGAISFASLLTQMSNQLHWLTKGIRAGVELHDKMLSAILKAPTRFFDTTPVGRLLQRFSRDLEAIDMQLQWSFESAMQALFQVLVSLGLILVSVPFVVVVIIPVGILYWNVQLAYRISAREVKRMDSVFRSPRYAHFKETLGGLAVIRAYKKQEMFRLKFFDLLEKSQKASMNHFYLNRWFSLRIPFISGLISGSTAFALIVSVSNAWLTPATAGLVLLYAMSFWGALNWGIRILADLESRMTSIERIRFMTRVPSEQNIVSTPEVFVPVEWPSAGRIQFKDVHAKYADELPEVVKGLTVDIPAGAQVGIVGRTGAGKSTLFQMLYRFINLNQGRILIDNIDIASVDLNTLRSRLAIIPQDPTLFMGTMRGNLDPYSKRTDADIWSALQKVELEELVRSMPKQLDTLVSEGGGNLSQGQRQLLCLARALLLDAKIIMLDEATASVDVVSDSRIQKVLRQELKGRTVLVIAHRLGTVADLDFLMVMSDGKLESFRKPEISSGIASEFGLAAEPIK